jgi:hypothetical protein
MLIVMDLCLPDKGVVEVVVEHVGHEVEAQEAGGRWTCSSAGMSPRPPACVPASLLARLSFGV